jgi:enterochelin esterase-like enzyme
VSRAALPTLARVLGRDRLLSLSLTSLIGLVGLGAVETGTSPPGRTQSPDAVLDGSFRSHALRGTVHYSVVLPRSYSHSGRRYPVIYFLHGLPAEPTAYRDIGWVADALRRTHREAILIGAQGARKGDADPEWLNWGGNRNWEAATARELVAVVDSRYRTIASRAGRVLIGVSAGGYGAALIGYHNPGTFSVFQSWSGYFVPTDPDGTRVLDLGSRKRNEWASLHALAPKLQKQLGRYYGSTSFGFFMGSGDSSFFLDDDRRLGRELPEHQIWGTSFKTYPGEHSLSFWREHATWWISRALAAAASPG